MLQVDNSRVFMMPSFRVMSPKFVHKVLIRYYHETLNPERKELWWGMVKNFLELFMCNRACMWVCTCVCVYSVLRDVAGIV